MKSFREEEARNPARRWTKYSLRGGLTTIDGPMPRARIEGILMRRAGWIVAATICSAAAVVAGYEVFDPDRPLDVRFWTALLIGAAALAVLAVQRAVAKPGRAERHRSPAGGAE
jgi:hypothetical protein